MVIDDTDAVGEIPKLLKPPADSDPFLFIGGCLHILTLNTSERANLKVCEHNCSCHFYTCNTLQMTAQVSFNIPLTVDLPIRKLNERERESPIKNIK